MRIVPQSALVTIEIDQVDPPWVAARWDLEGSRQQQKRMAEPLDRSARPAVAPLSRVASATAGWSTCWRGRISTWRAGGVCRRPQSWPADRQRNRSYR